MEDEADRDFNPYQFVIDDEGNSEGEAEDQINNNANQLMWEGLDEDIFYTVTNRLDGFTLCADTPLIANFHGSVMLRQFPTVFHRHLNKYKGLSAFIGSQTKHIYEFELFSLSNLKFSALIVTDATVHRDEEPSFTGMVKSYHAAIRNAILSLDPDSVSRKNALSKLNETIVIYESDWERFSRTLINELHAIVESEEHDTSFPNDPRFLWCMFQYGQNRSRKPNETNQAHEFADLDHCVRITGNWAAAVHCATDYEAKDYIMWWIPSRIRQAFPVQSVGRVFWPGLVPGLGNITYTTEQDESMQPIAYTQFYTRVYSHVHKDNSRIFQVPMIAKYLASTFSKWTNGTTLPRENSKDKQIRYKKVSRLIDDIPEMTGNTTEARLELVCTVTDRRQCDSATAIIQRGFNDCQEFLDNHFQFSRQIVHAMPTSDYKERVSMWCGYFRTTLDALIDKVEESRELKNAYLLPPHLLPNENEFHTVLAIETILNFMIFGVRGRGFSEFVMEIMDMPPLKLHVPTHFSLKDDPELHWPFKSLGRDDDNHTLSLDLTEDQLHVLRPQMLLNVDDEVRYFVDLRRLFMENPNDRSYLGSQIAKMVLRLIKIFHSRLTHSRAIGKVTLDMMLRDTQKYSRNVTVMTPFEFVERLSTEHVSGLYPQHQPLRDILIHLLRSTTDPESDSMENLPTPPTIRYARKFFDLLVPMMKHKMRKTGTPWRFTFNNFQEYILILEKVRGQEVDEVTWQIFKKAVKFQYRASYNKHHLNPFAMCSIFQEWKEGPAKQDNIRYSLVGVANLMHQLIRTGKIPSDMTEDARLKRLLLDEEGRGVQVERPSAAGTYLSVPIVPPSKFRRHIRKRTQFRNLPSHSSSSSSEDDVPLATRVSARRRRKTSHSRAPVSQEPTANDVTLNDSNQDQAIAEDINLGENTDPSRAGTSASLAADIFETGTRRDEEAVLERGYDSSHSISSLSYEGSLHSSDLSSSDSDSETGSARNHARDDDIASIEYEGSLHSSDLDEPTNNDDLDVSSIFEEENYESTHTQEQEYCISLTENMQLQFVQETRMDEHDQRSRRSSSSVSFLNDEGSVSYPFIESDVEDELSHQLPDDPAFVASNHSSENEEDQPGNQIEDDNFSVAPMEPLGGPNQPEDQTEDFDAYLAHIEAFEAFEAEDQIEDFAALAAPLESYELEDIPFQIIEEVDAELNTFVDGLLADCIVDDEDDASFVDAVVYELIHEPLLDEINF